MKRLTTLTGKNLPRLSVGKPGWPEALPRDEGRFAHFTNEPPPALRSDMPEHLEIMTTYERTRND
jgi:hypothetical protein